MFRSISSFCAMLLIALGANAAEISEGQVMGAESCGASTCHNASKPWPNSSVSQREYSVWKERDPHAQSYATLTSSKAKRIARTLGLGDPTTQKKCLGCHAYAPPNGHEANFDISEGITCEACHGPASKWLGVHSSGLYFYGKNVEKGMFPTSDPSSRAELCLGCHVGDSERFVSHDMMSAGHPTLPFELGFYSWFVKTDPNSRSGYAHFTVDDDYLQRKAWPFGAKVWAIGQVAQAKKVLDLVVNPKHGVKGLFPELAHFECRSCHRSWGKTAGSSFALPRIKSSNLLFTEFATELVDKQLARRIRNDVAGLRGATSESWEAVIASSKRLRRTLAKAKTKLEQHTFTAADSKATLLRINTAFRRGRLSEYEAAEQAVLSARSLVDELVRLGEFNAADSAAAVAAMNRSVESFQNVSSYSRRTVRASLNEIARIVKNNEG